MNIYTTKVFSDGNTYYDLPLDYVFPTEDNKYFFSTWKETFTWSILAYMIYTDASLDFMLIRMNGFINPWSIKPGDSFRFLNPEFLNEVSLQ